MSPQNISMGGGGTAYITGFEANFINPANLMIREQPTNLTFGIGEFGAFYNPVTPAGNIRGQANAFRNYLDAYQPGTYQLTPQEKSDILAHHYKNNHLLSEHQHRFDAILGGLGWQHEDYALSITARARTSTQTEVGRGWYDSDFIGEKRNNSTQIRDMSLVQQSQFLYEFSVGYAQTFDFVTGLIPRLGKLYIGIAPKFVVGGSYLNLQYDARYRFTNDMAQPQLVRTFKYNSTGNFSDATSYYALTGNASGAISHHFPDSFLHNRSEYTQPTGYGGGFDFGLVYVLSLGSDLSLARPAGVSELNKSLRLGFSVTDLGFVRYNKKTHSLFQPRDTLATNVISTASTRFEGTPGQYISFFDDAGPAINPLSNGTNNSQTGEDNSGFTTLLPTSFNAGMLLQVNRLKLSGDLTLGLNDSAFNNTRLTAHFGIEFSPIELVPVRAGMQIAAGRPVLWSVGTGIEKKHWELSVGSRFLTQNNDTSFELVGAAFGGLKFHF